MPVQVRHRAGRRPAPRAPRPTGPARRRRAGRRRSRRTRRRHPSLRGTNHPGCTVDPSVCEQIEDGVGRLHARPRPARRCAPCPPRDDGGGQERHRVGQVGFDGPVPRRDRARADAPAVRRRSRRPSTPASRSIDTVIATCGADGTDVAGVHDGQPVGERRARQQQSRDELRRRRRVDLAPCRPRTEPLAAHLERQPVAVEADAEPAQPVEQRRDGAGAGLLVAVERDDLARRARRPAGRTAARCPPGRSRCARPAAGAIAPLTVSSVPAPSSGDARGSAARRSSGRCRGCAARR